MSAINGVSASNSASALMQVLDDTIKEQAELAEKFVKVAAEQKIQAAKLSTLGQVVDIYA